MLTHQRFIDVEITVEELGGAEYDFVGEVNSTAVCFNSLAFLHDFAGQVPFGILVILPFDINVRPDEMDRIDRIECGIDADPVDILQGGQHFGAQTLAKDRPPGALVHVSVGRHGNDERVTQLAGRFEVTYVADVQQVEGAMSMHHDFPRLAQLVHDRGQLFDRPDFLAWRVSLCPTDTAQWNDVRVHPYIPLWLPTGRSPRKRNQSDVASAIRDAPVWTASRQ